MTRPPEAAFGRLPLRGQRQWPGKAGSTAFPEGIVSCAAVSLHREG